MKTNNADASARTKSILIAAVALSFFLASTALAGTGVGAVFNLGQTNSVNERSVLSGSTDKAMLLVTNTNSGTSARAITALNNNATASALMGQNSGNGPALSLFTIEGKAPMTVNSKGKVTNLNADLLDNLDSASFMGSALFRVESAVGPGTLLGDGTYRANMSCPSGSLLLSGGPANISSTSTLLESFPASTTVWGARIHKNGFADNFNVVVLCARK